jgi:hypothetical protein
MLSATFSGRSLSFRHGELGNRPASSSLLFFHIPCCSVSYNCIQREKCLGSEIQQRPTRSLLTFAVIHHRVYGSNLCTHVEYSGYSYNRYKIIIHIMPPSCNSIQGQGQCGIVITASSFQSQEILRHPPNRVDPLVQKHWAQGQG